MSKEFEELKKAASKTEKGIQSRKKERYQYARSLGFSAILARQLTGSSIERILRLSKELSRLTD